MQTKQSMVSINDSRWGLEELKEEIQDSKVGVGERRKEGGTKKAAWRTPSNNSPEVLGWEAE